MTTWTDYLFPKTVQEALQMLAAHAGKARIIAGATELPLQAQRGQCNSEVMIDLRDIPGLGLIEEREGYIHIGPQVTHAQIAASPLIKEKAGVLAAASGCVGGPQIRHVATLVGNVVNAMPAADGAVALFSLNAEIEVTDLEGSLWTHLPDIYLGVGQCRINPCAQFVTGLRFRPLPECSSWSYKRLGQRKALILPILNTAVVVCLEGGRFSDVRIAIGPVAPTPLRAQAAEAMLLGQEPGEEVIAAAARAAEAAARPRDSLLRGSAEYRKAMVEVLVRRGLTEAVEGARGRPGDKMTG